MNDIKRLPAKATYLLLAYMPFHIFLTQSLSLLTGGLSVWKAAKDVFLSLAVLLTIYLVYANKKQNKIFTLLTVLAIAYGLQHLLVWFMHPDIYRPTAILGTVYNTRVVLFAILGMGAALLAPNYITQKRVIKLVVVAGTIVAALGVLQYFLPKDILTHFGYSVARGVKPAFFIDDKVNLPRIMSTIRDPNSLAVYLLVPICLTISLLFTQKKNKQLYIGALCLQVLALFLTFSRGGWLGAIIAVGSLLALHFRSWIHKHIKIITISLVSGFLILGVSGYILRDQYIVQNLILHSDESTQASEDSNALHIRLAKEGAIASIKTPEGHGPGTAGIVSIQSPNGRLTENYYVQISYEVGIIGLVLFLSIWGCILYVLQKQKGILASSLLASAIAYLALSMLMHLWTNEAVASQWWILTGICLGLNAPIRKSKNITTKNK
jgi:hypothetical protein